MAITATATLSENIVVYSTDTEATLPDGFTAPSVPTITPDAVDEYTVDLAISNADAADPTIGLNNIISAAEIQFTATRAAEIGLDATATIQANLIIRNINRLNDQGLNSGNIFITGTEVYRCFIRCEYEVS